MMKVLHVLHSPRAEGTVKLVIDWLAEPGLLQEVLVLNPNPAEMTGEIRRRASWFEQGNDFPASRAKFPWMVKKIWQVCRNRRPDLVICWANGFSPWILGGAWLAGVTRLITHAGNPPAWNFGGRFYTFFCTFTTWLTNGRMVCCSHYVARQFARSPAAFTSVLRVAYNCAPVESIGKTASEARMRRTDRRPQLIMVATLESHKDHATLLRAMPMVVLAIPTVQLWLVGDGSLRGSLQAMSLELGLKESVEFLGSRRDVPDLLGLADIFVFSTTHEEGLGTVLVEAMAAGIPIVASDVPACCETLSNGKFGTLVPAGDARSLAQTLIDHLRRLQVPPLNNGHDSLGRFAPSVMIDAYLAMVS